MMLSGVRKTLFAFRLGRTVDILPICRRSYNVKVLGSPSKLRGPEIPNADLKNKTLEIDLPITKHERPRRAFDGFREKVAWTDGTKDRLYEFIELELRGHDAAVLRSYQWFLSEAARHLEVEVSRVFDKVPTQEHLSTLKSAFVYKKHQVQYEWRTFFKYIQLRHLTESTALTYLEYVQRNLPEGVAMNVAYLEMREMPEYLRQPPSEEDLQEHSSVRKRSSESLTDDAGSSLSRNNTAATDAAGDAENSAKISRSV